MIRTLFVGVAIAGLMSLGSALSVHWVDAQSQPDQSDRQEQKATKSASGKVLKIWNRGHFVSVEVVGENKSTTEFVEFVVDRNTKVNGQVKEGTAVTVEYQAMEGGQNLAVSITARAQGTKNLVPQGHSPRCGLLNGGLSEANHHSVLRDLPFRQEQCVAQQTDQYPRASAAFKLWVEQVGEPVPALLARAGGGNSDVLRRYCWRPFRRIRDGKLATYLRRIC